MDAEWEARVKLAACYRMVAKLGMDDLIYNHISARVPGHEDQFLHQSLRLPVRRDHRVDPGAASTPKATSSTTRRTSVNVAAFVIHAAIHTSRTTTPPACCTPIPTPASRSPARTKGLLPLSQFAMRFYDRQAFHDYEGVAIDLDEQTRLVRDLGPHKVMLMRNHGILTVGRTPGEAFMLLYYFERAARIQLRCRRRPPPAPRSVFHATTSARRPRGSSGNCKATSSFPASANGRR